MYYGRVYFANMGDNWLLNSQAHCFNDKKDTAYIVIVLFFSLREFLAS